MATTSSSASASRGSYNKWKPEDMEKALNAMANSTSGLNEISRTFGIPKATLLRHHRGTNKFSNGNVQGNGRRPVLSDQMEKELVDHIKQLEAMLFGITKHDLQRLAFEFAARNHLTNNFNKDDKKAGRAWFEGFMRRHRCLSLRTPESTSISRASGFNRESVARFFSIIEDQVDKHCFDGQRIFNMDETAVSTVQKRNTKILSQRGKKQVGTISSAERGANTTVVICMSASGTFIPPMLVFKRIRMSDTLRVGAPDGSLCCSQAKGWMDTSLFIEWLKHFISNAKPSQEKPVLLILDGHKSHTTSIEAIELAQSNGVVMVSLPPHCTHKLQPLDVGYFKAFQTYYNMAIERKLRSRPGYGVLSSDVSSLVNEAFSKASVVETAKNAFKKCGIWPVNRNIFTDLDFVANTIVHTSETGQTQGSSPLPQSPSLQLTAPSQGPSSSQPTARLHGPSPSQLTVPPRNPPPPLDPSPSQLTAPHQDHSTSQSTAAPAQDPSTSQPTAPPQSTAPPQPTAPPQGPSPSQLTCISPDSTDTVIQTKMDGRCLFRSLAIADSPALKICERDLHGEPSSKLLQLSEKSSADFLRASTMSYIINNISHFADLVKDIAVLNADLPEHLQVSSLEDRIELVSTYTVCRRARTTCCS